ncbi:MAG: hypothetical protein WC443_05925 [Desulfobaccales bacterium]
MHSSKKSILAIGICLATLLLSIQAQQAFGFYMDSVASVTFYYDGSPISYTDTSIPVADKTATDSSNNPWGYPVNLSGAAKAAVRGYTSLGASATATDAGALGNDSRAASSLGSATRYFGIVVTTGGTITYGLSISGSLSLEGDSASYTGNPSLSYSSLLRGINSTGGYYEVPGTNWSGVAVASISDATLISASVDPGYYEVYMQLNANASIMNFEDGTTASAICNAFDSLGFGGTDVNFWDIVDGTASFYCYDDPSIQHIGVPLPGSFLLLSSGLLGLAGWRRFRKG